MPVICKHGLEERFCAICREAGETVPLRPDALRVTKEGRPALILRTKLGFLDLMVLVLEGTTTWFETVKEISLRLPMTVVSFNQRKVLTLFLESALRQGYIFHPKRELTGRKKQMEGPARCDFDHCELSLEKGSLGCSVCRAYLCQCGRCLCGYTGKNHLGQVFSYPPLPIPREERLEYIRVVRFCELNLRPVPPVLKRRHLYLVK
jgi:hypothetical protein